MAIDASVITLGTLPSPLYTYNQADLGVTVTTTLASVATNATRVELFLLYTPLYNQTGGLKPVKKKYTNNTSPSPTGTYSFTVPAADFAAAGLYQLESRAVVASGSPEVISFQDTQKSTEFKVLDQNQADQLNNTISDLQKLMLSQPASPIWKTVTLTGKQIKAGVADNTQQTSLMQIDTLPAGAIMVGGMVVCNVASALTAAKMNLGGGSSGNNVVASAAIDSTATTGVATSFVPILAGSTALNIKPDASSGHAISEFADAVSVTLTYGYVVPVSFNLKA